MPKSRTTFDMITLGVSRLARSKDFYVAKLGFGVEYEGDDFAVLRTGGTRILLHARRGNPPPADIILQVRVADVRQLHDRLRGEGVNFWRGPIEVDHEGDPWSPRREARLRDPDGYEIALFSPVRTSRQRVGVVSRRR